MKFRLRQLERQIGRPLDLNRCGGCGGPDTMEDAQTAVAGPALDTDVILDLMIERQPVECVICGQPTFAGLLIEALDDGEELGDPEGDHPP